MQHLSPSVTGDELKARIAELESRLTTAAADAGDIDIRAVVTSDGLDWKPWSCEIIMLGEEPIERRPSQAEAVRLAGDAFEQCGSLLLGLPRECLPACLAKPLAEHADDPAAAWVAAMRRMHNRHPEHELGIEQTQDAVFLYPAVAKSVAVLGVIRQRLKQPAAATTQPVAAIASMGAAIASPVEAAPDSPPRTTAEVVELLQRAEELVRHDTTEKLKRDGLDEIEAAAESLHCAAKFRSLGYTRMHKRLEAMGLLRENERPVDKSADKDSQKKAEAFEKKIQVALRKLSWRPIDADHDRLNRRTVDGGQAGELFGNGASVKRKRSDRRGESDDLCRNCGLFRADGHADDSVLRYFCIACSRRHPRSRLDAILSSEQEPECASVPPGELLRARQAVRGRAQ